MKVDLHVSLSIDPLGCTSERVKELIENWLYNMTSIADKHVTVDVDSMNIEQLKVEEGD